MNFRIDRLVTAENRPVFLLSGQIDGRALATLRNLIENEPGALTIDLTDVNLVDREAVLFLARIETREIELRNCPPYIREWIGREGQQT